MPKLENIEFSLLTTISTAAPINMGGARSNNLFNTENNVAVYIFIEYSFEYSNNLFKGDSIFSIFL